jgi:DNA-binding NarL/FixJ family response regulator
MTSTALIKVAVIDDALVFREQLCKIISEIPGMHLLEVCKDQPAGLRLVERECPDVLLVDLGLPTGSGLRIIQAAQQRWGKRCTSAVLTKLIGNEEHLLTDVGAGAKGYLDKNDEPDEWRHTVQILSQGQSPLHGPMARVFQRFAKENPINTDTPNEVAKASSAVKRDEESRNVLLHIATGYTVAETSIKLGMSVTQVGKRIRNIYDQLLQPGPTLSARELELLQLRNKGFTYQQCAELMGITECSCKELGSRAHLKLGATNLQTALYEARLAGLIS